MPPGAYMRCGHNADHYNSDGNYCVLCATEPTLTTFMINREPGAKLPHELTQAGEALARKLVITYHTHLNFAKQYDDGERGRDRMSEASRREMAAWNTEEAYTTQKELDYLAQALGYEVLPLPAMPRYQHPDGRRIYL